MPASSLFIACQQVRCSLNAGIRISLVAALSQCEARHGLRPRDVRLRSPWRPDDCCLPALRYRRPVPTLCFSGLTSFTVSSTCYHCTSHSFRAYASTGLLPVPAARLDTRPVASGYLGGLRTHSTTRPCQDAPQRSLTLRPAHWPSHIVTLYTGGSSHFVTSMTAPIASGWSESCRVGLSPTEKTPPLHGAHPERT